MKYNFNKKRQSELIYLSNFDQISLVKTNLGLLCTCKHMLEETFLNIAACLHLSLCGLHIWPRREKTCLRGVANNKSTDQPVHPRSLISAFVIRLLEGIISRLAANKIPSV